MASQIIAGLDGVDSQIDPGPMSDEPYEATDRPTLPRSLIDAIAALKDDTTFRDKLGATLVDYIIQIKQHEIDRFFSHVTDWEQREYFEVY